MKKGLNSKLEVEAKDPFVETVTTVAGYGYTVVAWVEKDQTTDRATFQLKCSALLALDDRDEQHQTDVAYVWKALFQGTSMNADADCSASQPFLYAAEGSALQLYAAWTEECGAAGGGVKKIRVAAFNGDLDTNPDWVFVDDGHGVNADTVNPYSSDSPGFPSMAYLSGF